MIAEFIKDSILLSGNPKYDAYTMGFNHSCQIRYMSLVNELEQKGLTQSRLSSYYYPIPLVQMKDSSWGMCIDYGTLKNTDFGFQ